MFEAEVCAPVSESLIRKVINGLKNERAPGVNSIISSMLKLAGPGAVKFVNSLSLGKERYQNLF